MNAGDDASTGSLTLSGLQLLDPTIPERADAGIIGNGETAAIVGRHGAVTWWCVPRFDGYPVLAWALDPRRGGYLDVAPDPPAPFSARLAGARQAYYERSKVLVTRVETEAGAVALVDLFPWQQPGLVREVWLSRPMALALSLALTRASVGGAWHAVFGYPLALETRDAAIAVVLEPIASEAQASQASWWDEEACRLRLSFRGSHPALEGSHAPDHTLLGGLWPAGRIAVAYGRGVAQARNAARALVRVSPATAVEADREWLQVGTLPPAVSPAHRALLERSLLALRALTFPKTGAVLAAATASWPATPSGDQNWDYRTCGCATAAGRHRRSIGSGFTGRRGPFIVSPCACRARTGTGHSRCSRWTAGCRTRCWHPSLPAPTGNAPSASATLPPISSSLTTRATCWPASPITAS